jgi:hypothetical protein
MVRPIRAFTLSALFLVGLFSSTAHAQLQERLCDPQYEDCRASVLDLIRNEQVGIDVGFWFMEDGRFANELVAKFKSGVPVRILVDQRANASKRLNATMLQQLADAGIPMRDKFAQDILHFKVMLFHGQNVVEFGKGNYNATAFVAIEPNVNYDDEAVFFTNDNNLTNSFRRKFDDLWTDTARFHNYANITGTLVRKYPLYPIHPSMNFPPFEFFSERAVSRYNAEMNSIDAIVYRVTDHRHADAMIAAVRRGVPVRLISEPTEYRNAGRVWDAKHIDRMYMGGVQIKMRQHEGLAHEALVVLHGLGEVIFGSSNWTTTSSEYQDEHNYFYNPTLGKPWFFQWFVDQFNRKWNDTVNYVPFQPLPPDAPVYSSPSNGASGLNTTVSLVWQGGPWGNLYDLYVGTDPANLQLLEKEKEIGSPDKQQLETYTLANLLPGTTYYWRIVGKTWALLGKTGPTWSFTTAGTAPGGGTTPPPPTNGNTPYNGTAVAIPGVIQAENFDEGGQNVAWSDTSAGNTGGAYRTNTDVDIEATGDAGGGYDVGWGKSGEWLKYTVNVTTAGTYQLDSRLANPGSGGTFSVEVDGVNRTGTIAVPNTGNWQVYQTISTGGISLSAGVHVIRLVLGAVSSAGSVGNFNWFRLSTTATNQPASPTSSPYGGTPVALPGILQAENFDEGGEGIAYHDVTSANAGGLYRDTAVDIGAPSDASGGGGSLGWTKVGEWLKYTVDVSQTRNYTFNMRVANLGSGAQFRIEADGVDVTGPVSLPNTGAWDAWQTISVTVPLTQGRRVLTLVMLRSNVENSNCGNYDYFSIQ